MQKLENNILQKFLDEFITELKTKNEESKSKKKCELNIPFIISSIYQNFRDGVDEFHSFIEDLSTYSDYTISISDSQNDYNGIIDVDINLVKYSTSDYERYFRDYTHPDYDYRLCFTYDSRDCGYCECTPDMPDYREDKHCCGHECDAVFCSFSLYQVLRITSGSWEGDEHDYWEFEDEFYISEKELADKKEKEDRERLITELKNRIEADQKRLAELESLE